MWTDDRFVLTSKITAHNVAAGHVDGRTIAVAMGYSTAVRVWDLRSGELIKTGFVEDGHRMATDHVSINRLHGHDVIISGGHAAALSIWNLSGTIATTIEVGYSTSVWHVLPPDSIIVGGSMGILKLKLTPSSLMIRGSARQRQLGGSRRNCKRNAPS